MCYFTFYTSQVNLLRKSEGGLFLHNQCYRKFNGWKRYSYMDDESIKSIERGRGNNYIHDTSVLETIFTVNVGMKEL